MITRTAPSWQTEDWQNALSSTIRTPEALWQALQLPAEQLAEIVAAHGSFPVRVPLTYLNKIKRGDPLDPLLLQILPRGEELQLAAGFVADPLEEQNVNPVAGLLHKYRSRVLLVLSGACAINCRYCFRRHFPYQDNGLGQHQLEQIKAYLQLNPDVNEVILSGGDPLAVSNSRLADVFAMLSSVPHIRRIRIHTRLPVVIPQRIDAGLTRILNESPLPVVLVTHSNHPRELDQDFDRAMDALKRSGVTLLNQSVMLRDVNDSVAVLEALSERLFSAGVLPYYLHLLDSVAGAHHFGVAEEEAVKLMHGLQGRLPGFLLPRLVREEPGKSSKTLIDLNLS